MSKILVLGGSGFLGSVLCETLVRRSGGAGGYITVATRRIARLRHLQFLPTIEPAEVDVHDDAALARLVRGHDAVVNLIAILHGNASDFERVHVTLPRRLADACLAAGVPRLLQVSALAADADAPSMYLRSKAAGEAAIQRAGLGVTVLRPSVMVGAGDHFINLFARLQAWLPVLPLAGAQARFQPVWVDDVAEAIACCLELPESVGRNYACAGPEVWTLSALARLAGSASGHPRPQWAVPEGLARLQARLLEWLPGAPLMSRDNLLSMRVPSVAPTSGHGLEDLGIRPTGVEVVVAGMFGQDAEAVQRNRWRAAVHAR